MIDISTLQDADIDRPVKYETKHGAVEYGLISSWNDKFIFVCYGGSLQAKATPPDQLTYTDVGTDGEGQYVRYG